MSFMNFKLFNILLFLVVPTHFYFTILQFLLKALYSHFFRVFQSILCTKKEEPKKNESLKRENKLKAFIKRSSEPLLNLHVSSNTSSHQNQQNPPNQHQTLIIEEFEPDVFRQLIEYIHTGCVTLQPRTLLGNCT